VCLRLNSPVSALVKWKDKYLTLGDQPLVAAVLMLLLSITKLFSVELMTDINTIRRRLNISGGIMLGAFIGSLIWTVLAIGLLV